MTPIADAKEPVGCMQRLMSVNRLSGGAALVLVLAGCTHSVPRVAVPAADPPPRSSSGLAPGELARAVAGQLCRSAVPGTQHVVISTVAELGSVGHGLVGPGPTVVAWAKHAGSGAAVACSRFVPERHIQELWAVARSGDRVFLGGLGGEARDIGPLTAASFD